MIALEDNLRWCLEYNPQPFGIDDIVELLAVFEGEGDGPDWRWVLRLSDGRFVFLRGGCDYTGWDCLSSADCVFAASAEDAAEGEMTLSSKWWSDHDSNVRDELLRQLREGRTETRREAVGHQLGL